LLYLILNSDISHLVKNEDRFQEHSELPNSVWLASHPERQRQYEPVGIFPPFCAHRLRIRDRAGEHMRKPNRVSHFGPFRLRYLRASLGLRGKRRSNHRQPNFPAKRLRQHLEQHRNVQLGKTFSPRMRIQITIMLAVTSSWRGRIESAPLATGIAHLA